jgi:glycolate dehydrogenase FAD-binding subunit
VTVVANSAAARLAEISGMHNVISDPAQLPAYEIDGAIPAAAVRPGSRDEVSETVKFCAAEKLAIVPCGARSKLSMGAPPIRYDVALDLTRLDHIASYDPSDLTLSVEPGIPLQGLAGVLAGHRQFLPLAVPFLAHATTGGTIASGVHSPLRQAYGTARDFLLGVEFVTGDGALVKSGGLVVKNVAGYDLHKLMIGAMGTLGVITRLNFRTFPAPSATRIFIARFASAESALHLRRHIAQSPLRPLTVDILSPGAVEILSSPTAARIEPGPAPVDHLSAGKWAFHATFSGSGAVLDRYERALKEMAAQARCEACEIVGDVKNPASYGRVREFIPIALESSPATVIFKVSVLPTKLGDIFVSISNTAQINALRWAVLVGGFGVICVALMPSARDEDSLERVQRAVRQIFGVCAQLGGHATIPWSPSEWKTSLKTWGPDRSAFEQMRKLKQVFDPVGILAPGRFAGGI